MYEMFFNAFLPSGGVNVNQLLYRCDKSFGLMFHLNTGYLWLPAPFFPGFSRFLGLLFHINTELSLVACSVFFPVFRSDVPSIY